MDSVILPARARKRNAVLAHALGALQRCAAQGTLNASPRGSQLRLPATPPALAVAQLRDTWAEFLDRWLWDLFATFTVRDPIAPEAIDKRYRKLISEADRQLFGRRCGKRGLGIRWVRAWEPQRRGVYHLHALLGETRDLRPSTCRVRWEQLCCRPGERYDPEKPAGIARFDRIESSEAVRRYVSKYVAKGGELDLGGGPFRFLEDRPSRWPERIKHRGLSSTPLGRDVLARLRAALPEEEWVGLLQACAQRKLGDPLLSRVRAIVHGERESTCDPTPGDEAAGASLPRATRSPSASGQVCGPEPDGGPTAG